MNPNKRFQFFLFFELFVLVSFFLFIFRLRKKIQSICIYSELFNIFLLFIKEIVTGDRMTICNYLILVRRNKNRLQTDRMWLTVECILSRPVEIVPSSSASRRRCHDDDFQPKIIIAILISQELWRMYRRQSANRLNSSFYGIFLSFFAYIYAWLSDIAVSTSDLALRINSVIKTNLIECDENERKFISNMQMKRYRCVFW